METETNNKEVAGNKEDFSEVLTMSEAARYLKISDETLISYVNKKEIPHRRMGKRTVRFSRLALELWLAGK